MNVDDAKRLLNEAGVDVQSVTRLPNDTGVQLRCAGGAVVNVYDSGSYTVQGRKDARVAEALNAGYPQSTGGVVPVTGPSNRVFVVYGHDSGARTQLEAMLRRWRLEPLILDQLPSEGQTIIEKLESYTDDVGFAVVLATPDDEGNRVGHPDEKACRARQNVVLELGMLLATLGRKKVAILMKQSEKMERPSDIQGLIYIPFKDDLAKEAGLLLAKEMAQQGFDIPVTRI
jgi:predicted nucleotide-binding protein